MLKLIPRQLQPLNERVQERERGKEDFPPFIHYTVIRVSPGKVTVRITNLQANVLPCIDRT